MDRPAICKLCGETVEVYSTEGQVVGTYTYKDSLIVIPVLYVYCVRCLITTEEGDDADIE